MSNHYQVELEQQPIELYKLLKIADLVSGGGEAKVLISEGYVFLNGELETQKRKKIYHGDMIEFNGDLIELICHNEPAALVKAPKPKKTNTAKPHKTAEKPKATKPHPSKPKQQKSKQQNSGKRRAINF